MQVSMIQTRKEQAERNYQDCEEIAEERTLKYRDANIMSRSDTESLQIIRRSKSNHTYESVGICVSNMIMKLFPCSIIFYRFKCLILFSHPRRPHIDII